MGSWSGNFRRHRRRRAMKPRQPAIPPSSASQRTCVLVLGMHRSGTSSFTRVLNLLGLALGGPLLPPTDDNNAMGFWELQELVAINEEILDILEIPWDSYEPLTDGWMNFLPPQVLDA